MLQHPTIMTDWMPSSAVFSEWSAARVDEVALVTVRAGDRDDVVRKKSEFGQGARSSRLDGTWSAVTSSTSSKPTTWRSRSHSGAPKLV